MCALSLAQPPPATVVKIPVANDGQRPERGALGPVLSLVVVLQHVSRSVRRYFQMGPNGLRRF